MRLPGGSIRDDGKRLHLFRAAAFRDAAAEALLRLAHARYGARTRGRRRRELSARASSVSRPTTALPITFADPQLEQPPARTANRTGACRWPTRSTRTSTRVLDRLERPDDPARRAAGAERSTKVQRWPASSGTTPQAVADLRGVSALPVVRFGRAPEVLLPTDARRDVEQRGAEQPDPGVRRDPAQRRIDESASGRAGAGAGSSTATKLEASVCVIFRRREAEILMPMKATRSAGNRVMP